MYKYNYEEKSLIRPYCSYEAIRYSWPTFTEGSNCIWDAVYIQLRHDISQHKTWSNTKIVFSPIVSMAALCYSDQVLIKFCGSILDIYKS